jgi:nicotinate phosphoribosyltransferase
MKRSTGKVTLPGRKQVWRISRGGQITEDVIALHDEPAPPEARPLLVDVMRRGRRIWHESLEDARRRCRDGMASLPAQMRELDIVTYPVALSGRLESLRRQMSDA